MNGNVAPSRHRVSKAYQTILECNKEMFENCVGPDVAFTIPTPDGRMTTVHAHRYVLIARNPVFRAMFLGPVGCPDQDIHLCDVTPEAFREFLRFLYYEEAFLNEDITCDVMYIAKKYMATQLVDLCVDFLLDTTTEQNACEVLEMAILFDLEDLVNRCIRIIRAKTEAVIQDEMFVGISRDALERILGSDILNTSEVDLYNACVKWAKFQCENENVSCSSENLRSALGNALHLIRIPIILEEHPSNPFYLELLNKCERDALHDFQNDPATKVALPFLTSHRKRRSSQRVICPLISGVSMALLPTKTVSQHTFTISDDILLHAIDIPDMKDSSTMSLVCTISQNGKQLLNYTTRVSPMRKHTHYCTVVTMFLPGKGIRLKAGQFEIGISYQFLGKYACVPCGTPRSGAIDIDSLDITVYARNCHHIASIEFSSV